MHTKTGDLIVSTKPMNHLTLTQMHAVPKHPEEVEGDDESYKIEYPEDELERGKWGGKIDFMLTCVSYAVGLGNVWRFPYLVYKNGGGAFLIPYVLMLVFVGLPIFFLEFAFGQFASLGPIACWKISPLFKGIGMGMVMIMWYCTLYYNVIIAHTLFYLISGMNRVLPWSSCNNSWVDPSTCYDGTNSTLDVLENTNISQTPAEQYLDRFVLQISDGIENFGLPSWKLILCLLACWIIVLVVLIKGFQSLGKVSYFTALFPYIMLTILLIRSLFLEGSTRGILYYLTPRFERLKDPRVWNDAATQIFYSLSCCNGGLINLASFNKFRNNCCRDAIIVAVINCATSVYAGFVIFTNLGFMAYIKNTTIDNVAKGGPGLAFVVYPEAILNMPLSPLWAFLFFLMMVTLGYGSQLSMVEGVISGVQDELIEQKIIKTKRHSITFRVLVCAVSFLLGIPMVCPGGMYLLTLLDWACSGFPMLALGLSEICIICYFYGIKQFKKDIALMTKSEPNWFWQITWMGVTPIIIILLIFFNFIGGTGLRYGKYTYPRHWIYTANFIASVPIILVIINFLYRYCKDGGFILFKEYMKPHEEWGPAGEEDRKIFMKTIQSDDNKDGYFFQSKDSILKKFRKVTEEDVDKNEKSLPISASSPMLGSLV